MTKNNIKDYKSYSLNKKSVENLKRVLNQNQIPFSSDANAIHKAIDKLILDFKLKVKVSN